MPISSWSRLSPIVRTNCEFEKCNAIDGSRPHKFPANKSLLSLALSPSLYRFLLLPGRCNPRPDPSQVQMPITMISINVQPGPYHLININIPRGQTYCDLAKISLSPSLYRSLSLTLSPSSSLSLSLFQQVLSINLNCFLILLTSCCPPQNVSAIYGPLLIRLVFSSSVSPICSLLLAILMAHVWLTSEAEALLWWHSCQFAGASKQPNNA